MLREHLSVSFFALVDEKGKCRRASPRTLCPSNARAEVTVEVVDFEYDDPNDIVPDLRRGAFQVRLRYRDLVALSWERYEEMLRCTGRDAARRVATEFLHNRQALLARRARQRSQRTGSGRRAEDFAQSPAPEALKQPLLSDSTDASANARPAES
jgi:hypothetical protein